MKEKAKEKRTVGLVLEDISSDYSKEIIHSVTKASADYPDIRLIILAGIHDEGPTKNGSVQWDKVVHNSVYRLTERLSLDGLLLTLPNIGGHSENEVIGDEKSRLVNIPKVFISTEVENATTVRFNNETGIREAIDCLVNTKGITKLCMLGGRDDNSDAQTRKEIFKKCLSEHRIKFSETLYEKTNMTIDSKAAAERLLKRNPDTQAVFCVNDQVAVALYEVLKERGLWPGRDVQVFGFDNTRLSGTMIPPLASVGAANITLGQKAMELLLLKMKGEHVESAMIPTRLYGKDSLEYEMYEYTTLEMLRVDNAFVYRMFDDCFYRFSGEIRDRSSVDLKRLFFQFITNMLHAMNAGMMSMEDFLENRRLIEIFFENGAMRYTDPARLVKSIEHLQNSMNRSQKTVGPNLMNNRLFGYMKDKAIIAISEENGRKAGEQERLTQQLQTFLIKTTPFLGMGKITEETVIRECGRLGLPNSAIFLFETPVVFEDEQNISFPEEIRLMCVCRDGELRVLAPERRLCQLSEMLERTELPKSTRFAAFSVFYGNTIYGILLSNLDEITQDRGNLVANQLGRTLYLSSKN